MAEEIKIKKENIPLSLFNEVYIYFLSEIRREPVWRIAEITKCPTKQIKKCLSTKYKKERWYESRKKLTYKERLDLLDKDELEACERLYYIQKVAQLKMLEWVLTQDASNVTNMYRIIPSMLDIQKLQRIASNRNIEDKDNKDNESATNIVKLLDKENIEVE